MIFRNSGMPKVKVRNVFGPSFRCRPNFKSSRRRRISYRFNGSNCDSVLHRRRFAFKENAERDVSRHLCSWFCRCNWFESSRWGMDHEPSHNLERSFFGSGFENPSRKSPSSIVLSLTDFGNEFRNPYRNARRKCTFDVLETKSVERRNRVSRN